MSEQTILLDDHLLARALVHDLPADLADRPLATTNLFYVRLCRSATRSRGSGALLGSWSERARALLRPALLDLPPSTHVVPPATLAWSIAELAHRHALSTLGAECLAAARHLGAAVRVWAGDDGPRLRAAAGAEGIDYQAIAV